tara:strand:- start:67 stop:1758 length:1692 start_codon:yes stop_codon:yes gene_type:complete
MKILSLQATLASATNVDNAPVVRLFNSGTSNILVTRKDYAGTVLGSFIVPAGEVIYAEKYFTDTLEGSVDVLATKVAYSSMMSFVGSSSTGPTYTHSVSATNVDEGGSFTTTISTTNVDDGTNLYWELTGVVADDFSSGALTGTASISSNSATFSHTVDEDNLTEGTETATIKVYSDSGRNTQVGNTLTVTISDTSTTPPVTPGSTSFDGSNDYLYVGGNVAREAMADFGTGAYTIECWLKTTKGNQWIFYNADNHSGVRIAFGNNAGGGNTGQIEINEQSANGDQQTRTSGTYNDGNWHHVAFSRPDGGKVKIFVDGDEKAEGQDSGRNLSATAVTGFYTGRRGSGGNHFEGNIYGIRVIKGQAIYTGNFSVPTSAPTTTSQGADASKVTLLCATTDDVDASVVSPEASNTLQAFGVTSSSDTPFASTYDIRVWVDNNTAWAYRALSINGTEVWNGLSDPGVQYQTFTGYNSFTAIRVTRVGSGGKARLAQVAVQKDGGGYKVLQDGVDTGFGTVTWSSTGTATGGFSDPAADAFDGDDTDTSSPSDTSVGNYVDYTFSQFD